MVGLGQFILNCVQTALHTKRWWQLKQRLLGEMGTEPLSHDTEPSYADHSGEKGSVPISPISQAVIDDMVRLGEAEIANAEATIPLVEADSRLGWEPSMEYMADRAHLEWKIAQLRLVLDEEIPAYRSALAGPNA